MQALLDGLGKIYSLSSETDEFKLLPDLKLQPEDAFMAGFFEHKLVNLCRQEYSEHLKEKEAQKSTGPFIALEAERAQLGAPKLSFSGVLTDELRRKARTGVLATLLYHAGRCAHFLLYFAGLPFVPFLNLAFWCDYRYQKHTFDVPVVAKNDSEDGTQSKGKVFALEATALYGMKQELSNEKFKYDTAVRQSVAAQMEAVRKNGELARNLASEIDELEQKAFEYALHQKADDKTKKELDSQRGKIANRYAKQRAMFDLATSSLLPINTKYKTSTSNQETADYDDDDDYAFACMLATEEAAISCVNDSGSTQILDNIGNKFQKNKPNLSEDQKQTIKHWFKI